MVKSDEGLKTMDRIFNLINNSKSNIWNVWDNYVLKPQIKIATVFTIIFCIACPSKMLLVFLKDILILFANTLTTFLSVFFAIYFAAIAVLPIKKDALDKFQKKVTPVNTIGVFAALLISLFVTICCLVLVLAFYPDADEKTTVTMTPLVVSIFSFVYSMGVVYYILSEIIEFIFTYRFYLPTDKEGQTASSPKENKLKGSMIHLNSSSKEI